MSPGIRAPAGQRAARQRSRRSIGAFTFAEDPSKPAPEARIIWHAEFDPGTLSVTAIPSSPGDPDSIEAGDLAPWLSVVTDPSGHEHAVLSDGWHHIRIDVEQGSIAHDDAVLLHYHIAGLGRAEPQVLSLRRFLALVHHRRFARGLFPHDPRTGRWIDMLRVHDARIAGASHREIANALFGEARMNADRGAGSDSLRSRVRRLIRDARAMAVGGYRNLLRGDRKND